MKNLFILLLTVFAFVCNSNAQIKNVNVDEFEKGIIELNENEVLLDVRSKKEVRVGFIKGMKNIDFYDVQFENSLDLLDTSKTYYIYCAAGGRSFKAAKLLQKRGVKNIYNLNGGITAWKNAGKTISIK